MMGMKMYEEKLAVFAALLDEEKVYMDRMLDFCCICSWMGVDREGMDRYLMEELGHTGDDILMKYRDMQYESLKNKYGLVIDY